MEYFSEISFKDEIRQGDIFIIQGEVNEDCGWAFLLTKDCDIAQRKFGTHFSYLPISTLEEYVRSHHAAKQIIKLQTECFKKCEDIMCSSKEGEDLKVTHESLIEWVVADGIKAVAEQFGLTSKVKSQLEENLCALQKIETTHRNKTCEWDGFVNALNSLKRKKTSVKKELAGHIKSGMGEGFYFVPTLPNVPDAGFVVNLRDIRSIDCNYVYPTLHKARSNKATYPRLVRVGRFKDFLRFSIAQNAALLFSKIGMRTTFEDDTRLAIDVVSDGLTLRVET